MIGSDFMGKVICPKCKNEVALGVRFCPKCGEKLDSNDMRPASTQKGVTNDKLPTKNKSKTKIIIFVVVLVLLIILASVLLFLFVFNDKETTSDKNNNNNHNVVDKDDDDSDDQDDEPVVEKLDYYGNTYVFSQGYAWLKDSSYIYLINDKGRVINKFSGKNNDGYYDFQDSEFKDGYAMIGNVLYNDKGEKVEFTDNYTEIAYYDDALLVVTTKEEDYKGTIVKKGIYDLENNKYVFALNEDVYDIFYLGEEMYLLYYNDSHNYVVYDARNGGSFDLGDRFDVLKTEYRDGYIIYQDTNKEEVYAIDRLGNKTLIVGNSRHAEIGQYSDGLVFINDSFYDIKGNNVIDLKDEGISNLPLFINGYALVFFDTGYFTVLSKETKEYMFEPKAYTSMGNTYNGTFELGFYEDQKVISENGYLIVRLYNASDKTKHWAIMDVNGDIVYEFSEAININTVISDNDYIGVSNNVKQESYYVSTSGKKLEIVE